MKACTLFLFHGVAPCIAALTVMLPVCSLPLRAETPPPGGWELVFTDTFDREELGKDWGIVEGSWKIEEGALVGSGTLLSARGFPGPDPQRTLPGEAPPGFIRLEFEARTDVRPFILLPGAPPPEVSISDLSALIHVPPSDGKTCPTQTGYFFQFGGFMNKRNGLHRVGKTLVVQNQPEILVTPDTLHHVVAENDEGMLRLTVDGRTVLEQKETASLMGDGFDRVGLYFYTNTRVECVRVYVKRLDDGYF